VWADPVRHFDIKNSAYYNANMRTTITIDDDLMQELRKRAHQGNLASDAHLAAFAIEHAACFYSSDNDFSRFHSLRWKNPLH